MTWDWLVQQLHSTIIGDCDLVSHASFQEASEYHSDSERTCMRMASMHNKAQGTSGV